jgi:hypothetical protein
MIAAGRIADAAPKARAYWRPGGAGGVRPWSRASRQAFHSCVAYGHLSELDAPERRIVTEEELTPLGGSQDRVRTIGAPERTG